MSRPKPPKKSETVEVRLSYKAKVDFMALCRAEGLTVSEAIRGFIDGRLEGDGCGTWRQGVRWRSLVAAAVAGLALGALAGPSIAQGVKSDRQAFERMDSDRDSVISFEEFRVR